MIRVPAWLVKLMARPVLRGARLGPEDRIAIEVADHLRAWTLDGSLTAVWTHVPNEVGGGTKNAALRYSVAKALGLITGTPDLLFLWAAGAGAIELKAPGNGLTDSQKQFAQWCALHAVPHRLCRSLEEVRSVLISWGVLSIPVAAQGDAGARRPDASRCEKALV